MVTRYYKYLCNSYLSLRQEIFMSIYLFWVPRLQTENTMMNKTDLPPKPNYSSWCMFLNVLSLIFILLMNSINLKKELDYGEQAYITLLLKWERGHFADLYCLLNKLEKKKKKPSQCRWTLQTNSILSDIAHSHCRQSCSRRALMCPSSKSVSSPGKPLFFPVTHLVGWDSSLS